jgi:hypothetical protein
LNTVKYSAIRGSIFKLLQQLNLVLEKFPSFAQYMHPSTDSAVLLKLCGSLQWELKEKNNLNRAGWLTESVEKL